VIEYFILKDFENFVEATPTYRGISYKHTLYIVVLDIYVNFMMQKKYILFLLIEYYRITKPFKV
tara:strand:- start:68 stop:259 length:192 start_codon:yes stop_codon:yes gene_type:complete